MEPSSVRSFRLGGSAKSEAPVRQCAGRVATARGATQHHGRPPRPYLCYYSSNRPAHDHGVQPKVLIVFDDPLVEARFHQVTRSEIARAKVQLPL